MAKFEDEIRDLNIQMPGLREVGVVIYGRLLSYDKGQQEDLTKRKWAIYPQIHISNKTLFSPGWGSPFEIVAYGDKGECVERDRKEHQECLNKIIKEFAKHNIEVDVCPKLVHENPSEEYKAWKIKWG